MQDDIVADHIGEQRQQGILKAFSKAVHHYGLWNATHLWADFTANLHGKNRQFTAVLYWAQEAVSPHASLLLCQIQPSFSLSLPTITGSQALH